MNFETIFIFLWLSTPSCDCFVCEKFFSSTYGQCLC